MMATIKDQLLKNLTKNYFKTEGRASRQEYLIFLTFALVVNLIPVILMLLLETPEMAITLLLFMGLFNLYLFIPMITLSIRRLHDFGQSAILVLLMFAVGFLFQLALLVIPGETETNRFGKVPPKLW